MPIEGVNVKSLLERVIQMNSIILKEMYEQRKQFSVQQVLISSRLSMYSSSTSTTAKTLIDASSRPVIEINIKSKEYHGTKEENVITWSIVLKKMMAHRLVHDDEQISPAVSLLGSTALQWFVNLKLINQRPSTWNEFKDQLITLFQPHEIDPYRIRKIFSLEIYQLEANSDLVYHDRLKCVCVNSIPTHQWCKLSRHHSKY